MSPERAERDSLADIQVAAHRVADYLHGMTYTKFLADPKTQDAVIRNLEIVGEATKHVSSELRSRYPEIPWRGMAGLRDRLIHDYSGVNLDIVWQIATEELPEAAEQIASIQRDDLDRA